MTISKKLEAGKANRQRATVGMERLATPNDSFYSADTFPDPKEPPIMVGPKVLVRPAPRVTKIGSIHLADQAIDDQKYQNAIGKVLKISHLCWTDVGDGQPWCKVGDWVLFGRYAGYPITYDGVRMIILNDEEITAVLPDWKLLQAND